MKCNYINECCVNTLRVVDVFAQYVEGVVNTSLEVGAMEFFSQRLSPADIQQTGDVLVQTLQLRNRFIVE